MAEFKVVVELFIMCYRNTHFIAGIVLCGCILGSQSAFGSPLAVYPGVYRITVETLLPHLEENLRYATMRRRQCLGTQDVTKLFPILHNETFAGCDLTGGQTIGEFRNYVLVCRNPEAAAGSARFIISPTGISGVLDVKMGGKNMTLSQKINGLRLGACESMK